MILQTKGINFAYHKKAAETKAVEEMTMDVEEGEFVGIVGPSGCGKSTLLNLLAGIEKPDSGEILLKGQRLLTYGEKKGSYSPISLMPQHDQLFEWRTIEKNVCLGAEIRRQDRKKSLVYGNDLLKKYGLKDFVKKHPHELSGGMRQRAALIRTLVTKPDILLLDEPFSALDFQTRLSVCDDVYSIIKQEKKTAILVSHDISECISLCDKVVVLSPRPCHAVAVIDIAINKALPPLKRRESVLFTKYFEKIWKLLEDK